MMNSAMEEQFYNYLIQLGFPSSTIIHEPAFHPAERGRVYRPDFAILDPTTREPLAIFELKIREDDVTLSRGLKQVYHYLQSFHDKSLRGFLVTPREADQQFQFYSQDDKGKPKQVSPIFINIATLSNARSSEKKEDLIMSKKETIDKFLLMCFTASFFAALIAIADFIFSRRGVTLLTTERLALLGAALALIVIPYLQKFKALGIEIERFVKKDSN